MVGIADQAVSAQRVGSTGQAKAHKQAAHCGTQALGIHLGQRARGWVRRVNTCANSGSRRVAASATGRALANVRPGGRSVRQVRRRETG